MINITETTKQVKPAAIWARVSTTGQAETSLPSQVSRCKEKLEQAGYSTISTFQVDWTSLDLYACAEFQQLRSLIKNQEIKGLAVYDRDRLEAKGLQRLVFLSELKDAGVELIICSGPPIIEGPEGQIVEMALAIGKERSVMRARQGSKDGLRDRIKSGKPATFRNPYGYKWDKENLKLIPDENHDNVKLIFQMLLEGHGYTPIINELKKRGILSPSGKSEWGKVAISQIVNNPVYAGRYYGLRKRAVEPKKRRTYSKKAYGNTSVKKVPLSDAHYMPNIVIIDPPITWDQRGFIHDQLAQHQKLSSRNTKREYLLRGRIFCTTHNGQNGEPRIYHGQPHHDSYRYTCPVGGCDGQHINGPEFDYFVTGFVLDYLNGQPDKFYTSLITNKKDTETQLKAETKNLNKKHDGIIAKLANLEDERLAGRYVDNLEVYENLATKYKTQINYIKNKHDEILKQISQLGREKQAAEQINVIRSNLLMNIGSLSKPFHDQVKKKIKTGITKDIITQLQRIFNLLSLQLLIHPDNTVENIRSIKNGRKVLKVEIKLDINMPLENMKDIALDLPGKEIHNTNYYPLRFPNSDTLSIVEAQR